MKTPTKSKSPRVNMRGAECAVRVMGWSCSCPDGLWVDRHGDVKWSGKFDPHTSSAAYLCLYQRLVELARNYHCTVNTEYIPADQWCMQIEGEEGHAITSGAVFPTMAEACVSTALEFADYMDAQTKKVDDELESGEDFASVEREYARLHAASDLLQALITAGNIRFDLEDGCVYTPATEAELVEHVATSCVFGDIEFKPSTADLDQVDRNLQSSPGRAKAKRTAADDRYDAVLTSARRGLAEVPGLTDEQRYALAAAMAANALANEQAAAHAAAAAQGAKHVGRGLGCSA